MKNIIVVMALMLGSAAVAQDFEKNMASAKTAYDAGDLENARFAMEQMLRDLDIAIGKEIMAMLPTQLGDLSYDDKDDNVTGSGGGVGTGLFVHRSYGKEAKTGKIDVINNSPMITSINAFLALPLMGKSADGTQKVVKIQGYKSVLNKNVDEVTGKTGYTLQVPMSNTLFTMEMNDIGEDEIQQLANSIPLGKIAQIAQ